MQSRRMFTKMGFTGLASLAAARSIPAAAQTPEAEPEITMDNMELAYQGKLAVSNLPDLPTAPAGECAIVMQAVDTHSSAIAIIHNGSDEIAYINDVTGTGVNPDGNLDESVPAESIHAPRTIQPGEYGIATITFPEFWQPYSDVVFELELVSEEELDPSVVTMPVTRLDLVNPRKYNSLNVYTQNRSQDTLAEGSGFAGVFFTPDAEIAYWFTSMVNTEIGPGERHSLSHASTSMVLTDSFMVGFSGKILE